MIALTYRNESPGCLVEKVVNQALEQTRREAEALLLARLGEVTRVHGWTAKKQKTSR
ncbi:hypothetical protein ACH19I_18325 [Yersinia kristensenii]|uniref:hypothetical protein n=1 Tax=Yersinia kristensenii TaxID=28152 RepID=UPI003896CD60